MTRRRQLLWGMASRFIVAFVLGMSPLYAVEEGAAANSWAEERLPFSQPDDIIESTAPPLQPFIRPAVPRKPPLPPPRRQPERLPPPTPRFDPLAPPALTLIYPQPGSVVAEGPQTFVWNSAGPITRVKLTYRGPRCPLGGQSRGFFYGSIGEFPNKGLLQWNVPWIDGLEFTLRIIGYNAAGQAVATEERSYRFWPAILRDKPDTCIVINKARQRLYYLRNGELMRMHVISTAMPGYNTPRMRPGSYDRRRGAMGRVFSKQYAPRSHQYDVVMYYWLGITSSGSHGIHATSPSLYRRLGRPASHGCVRQHRADAAILWRLVSVGTPVYIE